MELRHLRYFIAVAEGLHFGRAARQLHISQPPLTRQIQQLERELGVALFVRTNRRVTLTHIGEQLLAEAKPLLAQFDALKLRASEAAAGRMGKLSIGFISIADYHVLPMLLREYRSRFSNVAIHLREATSDLQLDALRNGDLDIGIVLAPLADASIEFRTLFQEELVAALPAFDAKHDAVHTLPPISVRELAQHSFIMFPRHSAPGLFDAIVGTCARSGFSPNIGQVAIQMQTIISLVSVGMGVALVPASLTNLRRPGVVYRRLKEKSPLITTGLAWQTANASPTLRAFLDLVGQQKLPKTWASLVRNKARR